MRTKSLIEKCNYSLCYETSIQLGAPVFIPHNLTCLKSMFFSVLLLYSGAKVTMDRIDQKGHGKSNPT